MLCLLTFPSDSPSPAHPGAELAAKPVAGARPVSAAGQPSVELVAAAQPAAEPAQAAGGSGASVALLEPSPRVQAASAP